MREKKIVFKKLTVKETSMIRGGEQEAEPGEVPITADCSSPGQQNFARAVGGFEVETDSYLQLINF